MINIGTRQLYAFLEVARLQSFTKAAERIHITQAGLSMMVRELEAQLGTRLFERTTRSVVLTEAGRRLQPVALHALDELDSVCAAIGTEHASAARTLRIAATPFVSASLLPTVLRDFARRSAASIVVADVELPEVARQVLAGEADLGIGFFFKGAVGLARAPLYRFQLMCISPWDEPAGGPGGASRTPQGRTWSSLAKLPLIGLPADNPIQALVESQLDAIGRAHENRPSLRLFSTLIAMVEAGLGHAVIPSFALAECAHRRVRVAMLRRPAVPIDLYVASRRGVEPKPVAVEFTAALKVALTRLIATTGAPGDAGQPVQT